MANEQQGGRQGQGKNQQEQQQDQDIQPPEDQEDQTVGPLGEIAPRQEQAQEGGKGRTPQDRQNPSQQA